MTPTDILVIGGGIVGQVTAIELAQAGARITVVDAGINAGSTANAGSLHVQMQSRFMRLYPDQVPNIEASLPLYCQAVEEWRRLDAAYGPFELVRKGGLMLAEDATQLAFLEKKAAREAKKGVSVEILDRPALERIVPWLGPQIIGAELCRNEGKVNPLAANTRLRAVADALGVRFEQDHIRTLSAGNRIVAIGDRDTYPADRVVVAAAWGAGALVQGLGVAIPSVAEPLHMNITEASSARIEHLVQHAERSITLKQFKTGQIVIGGGWSAQHRGALRVPAVAPSSLLGNVSLAAKLVPAIGHMRIIRTWAGMNTTIDGASVIGPLPANDRVVMAVPGDAGYTLGPLVAKLAASCLLGQPDHGVIDRYTPARFAV
ncbi:FAD-binding oxidoreductase [Roseobacter sp. YSTF-M11]|uniref:FAD-binding oxidoreductase n=1 Tax=Roseobacter insulae TaxID=2859783 RepID=A0A9X1K0P7_9RHOB|nr:FAD-dependent oxidoreductase [Roseobacter insulae]MBW4708404.1 FAD-binding oxidoreductase [Roseobacter insulae]